MATPVIFMGTPEFAVPIMEFLLRAQYQIVAVYTQPDRRVGRGQQIAFCAGKRLALARGLPVIQPENMRQPKILEQLAGFDPKLIVVAAFGHILTPEILTLPKFGCLNVHPSLLPRHRGPSPVAAAILHGDEVTGVTIMLMDTGLDTGPILAQREVPISVEDTTGSLTVKLARVGADLLMETLPPWLQGKIKPQHQEESQATYSKIINKQDGEIDWHLSASELWCRIRAFNPWPGCYTWWQGKRLKITKAMPLTGSGDGEEGRVITLPSPSPLTVGANTGGGVLGLQRLQLEGKREMSVDEFVRGHTGFIGGLLT